MDAAVDAIVVLVVGLAVDWVVGAKVDLVVGAAVDLVVGAAVDWVIGAVVGFSLPHATDSSPMEDMLILLRRRTAALYDIPKPPVGVPVRG